MKALSFILILILISPVLAMSENLESKFSISGRGSLSFERKGKSVYQGVDLNLRIDFMAFEDFGNDDVAAALRLHFNTEPASSDYYLTYKYDNKTLVEFLSESESLVKLFSEESKITPVIIDEESALKKTFFGKKIRFKKYSKFRFSDGSFKKKMISKKANYLAKEQILKSLSQSDTDLTQGTKLTLADFICEGLPSSITCQFAYKIDVKLKLPSTSVD